MAEDYINERRQARLVAQDFLAANPSCNRVHVGPLSVDRSGIERDMADIERIVESAFKRATDNPDMARWKSVSMLAGIAAFRMAIEGDLYKAARLDGVAAEARRQMMAKESA